MMNLETKENNKTRKRESEPEEKKLPLLPPNKLKKLPKDLENKLTLNTKKNIKKIPDLLPETDLKTDNLEPESLELEEEITEKTELDKETSELLKMKSPEEPSTTEKKLKNNPRKKKKLLTTPSLLNNISNKKDLT